MRESFVSKRARLEKMLTSAFRRGVSAFRFGLILSGISDHLPIEIQIQSPDSHEKPINILSWNLLADEHLYQNFMNISGSDLLLEVLLQHTDSECIYLYQGNKLYHFFAELAHYLYDQSHGDQITITEELLQEFTSYISQPSLLALSRDPSKIIQKQKLVEISRQNIISVFLDQKHPYRDEFKLAIRHCLELIYNIENPSSTLKWKSRFNKICHTESIRNKLTSVDILCVQECSNPDDVLNLFKLENRNMRMLSNKAVRSQADHCAVYFDQNQFELVDKPTYFYLANKPCIAIKLRDLDSNEEFIVASIHHPGGSRDLTDPIIQEIVSLYVVDQKLPYYFIGDLNHPKTFFPDAIFAEEATMSGMDYGNLNRAIDGILTNVEKSMVSVKRFDDFPFSQPAEPTPINIEFNFKSNPHSLQRSSASYKCML